MDRDLIYENDNIAYDEQCTEETGGGIKCKNYEVCDSVLPKWWWDCKNCYICTNCDMMFGKLDIKDNINCPLCFEYKKGVSYPKCDHKICIDCFKRCFYGDKCIDTEPVFPYPDIEEEYQDDPDNPKWKRIEYVLIGVYNTEYRIWDDSRIEKYENEKYLRNCSLCRK